MENSFAIWSGKFTSRGDAKEGKVHLSKSELNRKNGTGATAQTLCGRTGKIGSTYSPETWEKMHHSFKCTRCTTLERNV